jgi:hypothetical protein
MTTAKEQIVQALGEAALALWPHLPHHTQQLLFEQVVAAIGEPIRHELATFLHDRHPRTSDAPTKAREVPEPGSLGG